LAHRLKGQDLRGDYGKKAYDRKTASGCPIEIRLQTGAFS